MNRKDILLAIGEVTAETEHTSQLGRSLRVYKDRGEFTGKLVSAAKCLLLAGYTLDNVKAYDNTEFEDRYTVVFLGFSREFKHRGTVYSYLALGKPPHNPSKQTTPSHVQLGKHLGKEIEFTDMPADCQEAALDVLFNKYSD